MENYEFFNGFGNRLLQMQLNDPSAFVFQCLEITQRLRIAELSESVILPGDFEIVFRVGGQDQKDSVIAVAFMQLPAGV